MKEDWSLGNGVPQPMAALQALHCGRLGAGHARAHQLLPALTAGLAELSVRYAAG